LRPTTGWYAQLSAAAPQASFVNARPGERPISLC
jgi:hypothetical protein